MKGGDGVFSNSQEFVSQPDKRQRSEEIPEDVVFQILPLLPVKSLLRFKCVCNSWRNLISDSQFQKMHMNQSIKANRLIYVLCERYHNRCFKLDYETLVSGKEIEMEEITYGSLFRPVIKDDITKYCSTQVLGSCNGFLCILAFHRVSLTYKSTLLLANPSTRETKTIFTPYPFWKDFLSFRVGFGYDAVNDDYKVLKIHFRNFSIDVYSSRKNKWDHKRSFPNYRHARIDDSRSTGKCVNGTMHWLAHTRNRPQIVAFDLTKEEFVNIPPPPTPTKYYLNDLGTDGRNLYSCHSRYDGKYEIWKMETYGVAESWTCISFLLVKPERPFIGDGYNLNLLNFPISEIDLYYVCGRLVLQNRRNKKIIRWMKLEQIFQGNTSHITAFSYVESLICPGSDGN